MPCPCACKNCSCGETCKCTVEKCCCEEEKKSCCEGKTEKTEQKK
ncbi:Metallothionein [Caenorhabditis elegans]|uniref:Metallothionein n=1 Tax=Caenorhabditis elegans TaxID=6239 RepID=G4SNI5_CAEEL|nr:Metallothionein [Caenorhabditis elegans]CCD72940.1 Metallothionein [Caenorhabditis elegans]|eukprot:NP_001256067.1 Uncharacterized protein CELE_W02F12.8 [Caenorhabditis elegans]